MSWQGSTVIEVNDWVPNTLTASGYSQDWLRGDEVSERDQAHPHEGLRLADKSGWIAVGQTISENPGRVNILQLKKSKIYVSIVFIYLMNIMIT